MITRDLRFIDRGLISYEAVTDLSADCSWVEFKVIGTQYDGRDELIRRLVQNDLVVFLVPEPSNQFDPNAVRVELFDGQLIGYLAREVNSLYLSDLQRGLRYEAVVSDVDSERDYVPPDVNIMVRLVDWEGRA